MRTALPFAAVLVLAGPGCAPDSTYSDIARKHLERKGTAAACCTTYGGGVSSPECAADAVTKCSFARDATVTVSSVKQTGSNAATVGLVLSGSNGNGVCTFEISNFGSPKGRGLRIQSGTCERR